MFLSIDQSTTSTTVFLFNKNLNLIKKISKPHKQIYYNKDWVEHDAEEIYKNLLKVIKILSKKLNLNKDLFVSITNQRETFVIFDKKTGKPLHKAIVWQCRRGNEICNKIGKSKIKSKMIKNFTGLELDTYFPASKLSWLLKNKKKLAYKIKTGSALFGTIDTYLIYRLTKTKSYSTDYTNASRTLFFDNKRLTWSKKLLFLFNLKIKYLPEVKESSSIFGNTNFEGLLRNEIPISGVIGDSQSSLFANQCYKKGDTKITLGTGSSILTNIGNKFKIKNKHITTLSFVYKGKPYYSYECLINFAGATISWLKNNLGVLNSVKDSDKISKSIQDSNGVFLIPAFVGLSSPHWLPNSKGMFYGLTPSVHKKHLIRSSLESIAFQIKDYAEELRKNQNLKLNKIYLDGGMTSNNFLIQMISNLFKNRIYVSKLEDMSAYGSLLMGLIGLNKVKNLEDLKKFKKKYKEFKPLEYEVDIKTYQKWREILNSFYLNNK
ncbi:MAG: Glycerol kinase [Alphaproteobacteria bacterium MarineAlpha5_Bin12]|nr:glycerol kinase [Pelagibacteraceae bacterium]PPR41922.1 MAG: Glycerol kinase [Alphaproteobacteria bacterium MarineAlpha5_Bin12]|tara:strand:- start:3559 stop:5034 length:1476 start_codon:yes stop_codon:yes gene_type:complete